MGSTPKVFVDANAMWKARWYRHVYVMREKTVEWGGQDVTQPVAIADSVAVIEKNPVQFFETQLIEKVAKLSNSGKLRLVTHHDAILASKLRARANSYCPSGDFFGAAISEVKCSIPCSRVIGQDSSGGLQIDDFTDPRFLEMCEITRAIQGGKLVSEKQVPDAFLLYCAEENGATHFLTLDEKLIRKARDPKQKHTLTLKVVWPSEILGEYWRYVIWPHAIRLIGQNSDVFTGLVDRKLREMGLLVDESIASWTSIARPSDRSLHS